MAKKRLIDSAKELENQAKGLFERIKKAHTDMGGKLQEVRRFEGKLIEKEQNAAIEKEERERAERLREFLESDSNSSTFHSDDERMQNGDSQPQKKEAEIDKPITSEKNDVAIKEKTVDIQSEKYENAEPVMLRKNDETSKNIVKAEEKVSAEEPQREREIKTASPVVETQTPNNMKEENNNMREETTPESKKEPASSVSDRENEQSQTASSINGYQAHPQAQTAYQPRQQQNQRRNNNAYQPRQNNNGGYQPRQNNDGGYQPRQNNNGGYQPRQNNNGGYQPRQNSGNYQPRPNGEGGYQPRQNSGNYQPRPNGEGGYQPRQNSGNYQPRQNGEGGYQPRQINNNGYQPRQNNNGGYQPRQNSNGGYQPRQNNNGGYQPRQNSNGGYQPRQQGEGGYQPRTNGTNQPRRNDQRTGTAGSITTGLTKDRISNYDPNKNNHTRSYDDDKRARSRKNTLKETAPVSRGGWDDETPYGNRRPKQKKPIQQHKFEPIVIQKATITSETITVKELSEKIGKPAAEIIKKLFILGIMATINQEIDFDTCSLIASDYNIELDLQVAKTFEEVLNESSDETDVSSEMVERPPVVTIMGHVDHGKTSLLDAIRHSAVTEGEAGGITQHIGAYTVSCKGRTITFIDTPGHEAFTSMRARGAQVTDIVILVVAADDGIMPQTIEAINHAKAANVPIIVAINKMDKEASNPERVKQQLTEHGLVSEEWGGETICVPVSAKTRTGIDSLLEMVLLEADVLELKANPNRLAKGTIIEAELHKGRGPIATVLVQNGTLNIGDTIVAGTAYGRVRAMMDDKGRRVNKAGPSQPVEVLGFSEVPSAGDTLNVAEADKLSRQVAEERRDKIKADQIKAATKVSLDDLFNQIAEGQIKDLNVIVKADVQGSVEAVKQALEKLSNDEVRVRCIHGGVGAITGSDVMFASASNAIVIGFNVRPDATARTTAERENVDIRLYRVIYAAIEDIQNAMKGLFAPVFKEVELGHAEIRSTFKVSGVGTIGGAYVQEGKIVRNAQVRVVRDGIVVHEGKISSLKRFKDDAKEVLTGYECGIGLENFNDLHDGDIIEAFVMEEQKR